MIITTISQNLADLSDAERRALVVDEAVFDNETRVKRVQRVSTTSGEEIALRLDNEIKEINDGDILALDDERAIVARIEPTDVLVIAPRSIAEALHVAHALGNRHLQAQFFAKDSEFEREVMVVRYDHTVEHFLDHVGCDYSRGDHVMPKAFRHAEHSH